MTGAIKSFPKIATTAAAITNSTNNNTRKTPPRISGAMWLSGLLNQPRSAAIPTGTPIRIAKAMPKAI